MSDATTTNDQKPLPAAKAGDGVSSVDLDQLDAALKDADEDLDALLGAASFEDPAPARPAAGPRNTPAPVDMPRFDKVLQEAQVSGIDLLRDVNLEVKVELGRSKMLVEDVLKLVEGSVVELDKLAGDPVEVFVNERLVARGEVLVLNDNFCVRVNEIVQSGREEDL